ncbi:MAG: lysophospholipid acyltransferase family protein [Candidatus Binatia bacterium]
MTIFDTPVLSGFLRRIARGCLALRGWSLEGAPPSERRYVIIAAPHTSNWDLPLTLALGFAFGLRIRWMGKDTLFRAPLGGFFRWLGGVAIDRSRPNGMVAASVERFRSAEDFVLVVPPEGTRSRVRYWKTGFYTIAHGAGVPIALGFLDYGRKVGGFGPALVPTGDIDADMRVIRDYYANVRGKYADAFAGADVAVPPERRSA